MIALLVFALSLSIVSTFAQTKSADFDGDGTVGVTDFLAFAEAFGSTQTTYDLDGSGSVDFGDFLVFVEAFAADNAPPVSSATYQVTFEATWSAATHPTDFPQDGLAHFSALVGATHNADVVFWASESAASEASNRWPKPGRQARSAPRSARRSPQVLLVKSCSVWMSTPHQDRRVSRSISTRIIRWLPSSRWSHPARIGSSGSQTSICTKAVSGSTRFLSRWLRGMPGRTVEQAIPQKTRRRNRRPISQRSEDRRSPAQSFQSQKFQ